MYKRKNTTKIGRSGFTLIEMIVYISLLSTILVSISIQSLLVIKSTSAIDQLIYGND